MAFRLTKARFSGSEIPLWLANDLKENEIGNGFTILIGKNGAGKSRLLAEICRAFRSLSPQGQIKGSKTAYGVGDNSSPTFGLDFSLGQHPIELRYKRGRLYEAVVNQVQVEDLEGFPLPKRVIATTNIPFDKFPIGRRSRSTSVDQEPDSQVSIYRYLGSKNGVGQTSSNSQIARLIDALMFASERDRSELARLNDVFKLLGYSPRIQVDYSPRFSASFSRNWRTYDGQEMQSMVLDTFRRRYTSSERRAQSSVDPELADKIYQSLHMVTDAMTSTRALTIELDLAQGALRTGPLELYRHISFLRSQGLLSLVDLRLQKIDSNFGYISFKDASSGEQGIVLTFLGIASEIEDESLVIIDEPEISLHPEWQENFVPLMISAFSRYEGCHFLLATHSPQIVAQAGEGSCAVVTMDDLTIQDASEFRKKSADYQLAEVFETPGYRNEYLAREGLAALRLASLREFNSDPFRERAELFRRVRPHLQDDDPVAQLIDAVLNAEAEAS